MTKQQYLKNQEVWVYSGNQIFKTNVIRESVFTVTTKEGTFFKENSATNRKDLLQKLIDEEVKFHQSKIDYETKRHNQTLKDLQAQIEEEGGSEINAS